MEVVEESEGADRILRAKVCVAMLADPHWIILSRFDDLALKVGAIPAKRQQTASTMSL